MDGSVEVCRVTISSYLSVRVGSGYRVEYYCIYFPLAVQNTGKRVVSKWTVVWKSAGHHFQYLSVRVGSGYRVEYYCIYFPLRYKTQGSVWSSKWAVVWKSAGSPFPDTYQ